MLYSFNFSKLFQIHLKMQQMLFQRLKMFWGSIPRTPLEVSRAIGAPRLPQRIKYCLFPPPPLLNILKETLYM